MKEHNQSTSLSSIYLIDGFLYGFVFEVYKGQSHLFLLLPWNFLYRTCSVDFLQIVQVQKISKSFIHWRISVYDLQNDLQNNLDGDNRIRVIELRDELLSYITGFFSDYR